MYLIWFSVFELFYFIVAVHETDTISKLSNNLCLMSVYTFVMIFVLCEKSLKNKCCLKLAKSSVIMSTRNTDVFWAKAGTSRIFFCCAKKKDSIVNRCGNKRWPRNTKQSIIRCGYLSTLLWKYGTWNILSNKMFHHTSQP